MFALLLFVIACAVGGVVTMIGLFEAPEGYEDVRGFHIVWKNDDEQKLNVSCLWKTCEPSAHAIHGTAG